MGIKKPSTNILQYTIYLVWTLLVKKGNVVSEKGQDQDNLDL